MENILPIWRKRRIRMGGKKKFKQVMDVEMEDVEAPQPPSPGLEGKDAAALTGETPSASNPLRDISSLGLWTLSSSKPGFGIENIRDDSLDSRFNLNFTPSIIMRTS
jgi:hypothetical protein